MPQPQPSRRPQAVAVITSSAAWVDCPTCGSRTTDVQMRGLAGSTILHTLDCGHRLEHTFPAGR